MPCGRPVGQDGAGTTDIREGIMGITLLDMLKNNGLITREQFDEALKNRVLYGGKIGTSLIELGYVREDDLARFLSGKLAVPFVDSARLLAIPPEIIDLIPRELALKYRVIPIYRTKKQLNLVMSDPADLKAIDEISFITGFIIKPVIAPEVRLVQALGKYYQYEIEPRYQQIIDRIEQGKEDGQPAASAVESLPAQTAVPLSHPSVPEPAELVTDGEEELEEVEVVDEEEWLRRVGHYSIDSASQTLARAEDREEIAEILMGYLRQEFDRVALFVIRGDTITGWKGVRNQEELKDFDRLVISCNSPSVLKTVADGQGYYLGAIPDTPMNAVMLDGLGGGRPAAALLLPLIIMGRVVNILYLEGGAKDLGERFVELHRLLAKAALAFEILIFREKILML
jgi:hypothetical protein